MSLTVKASGGSSYPILEADTYPAICYAVIDIGLQYNQMFGGSKPQVIITWEIPGETIEVDGEDKPRVMSEIYTASLHEKSKLRQMLDNWRGRTFTEDELLGFDLSSIVGLPCLLNVIHKAKKDGSQRAAIGSVSKLPKSMAKPEPYNDTIIFDLEGDGAMAKMADLPEWVQTKIKESETYRMMKTDSTAESGDFAVIDDSEDLPFSGDR